MSTLRYFLTAGALATAVITGCGSSSSGPSDSGSDSPVNTHHDTGTDGPCNFATFVLGLIANDTTSSALPSTNLGQTCTDDQKQSEFSSLF